MTHRHNKQEGRKRERERGREREAYSVHFVLYSCCLSVCGWGEWWRSIRYTISALGERGCVRVCVWEWVRKEEGGGGSCAINEEGTVKHADRKGRHKDGEGWERNERRQESDGGWEACLDVHAASLAAAAGAGAPSHATVTDRHTPLSHQVSSRTRIQANLLPRCVDIPRLFFIFVLVLSLSPPLLSTPSLLPLPSLLPHQREAPERTRERGRGCSGEEEAANWTRTGTTGLWWGGAAAGGGGRWVGTAKRHSCAAQRGRV